MIVLGLKDQVVDDIAGIFMDEEDGTEIHAVELEDVLYEIPVIFDGDQSGTFSKPLEGTYLSILTIYIAESAISCCPIKGQLLFLDGKGYLVSDAFRESGMIKIKLEVPDT